MKALCLSLALATSLTSAPSVASAQSDLEGYWDFVITSEDGEPQVRLRVGLAMTQDGRLQGETGLPGPSEMTGSVKGSTVEFFWGAVFEGTPIDFRFTGTATEDGMSGSVAVDLGEPGGVSRSIWTATRAGPLA